VGGHVINLYHLAHHLGTDRPFYGLQSQGLYGEAEPKKRIEDMAALYVDAIKSIQPHGPYLIGGYSFGDRVAFEMAELIREQGETIDLMVIIDYTSPVEGESLLGLDWDDTQWLTYTVNVMARLYGGEEISEEAIASLEPDKQWDFIREWLTRANLLSPGIDKTQVHGLINVLKANIQAHYSPGSKVVYPGRIALLRTRELPMETQNAAELTDDPSWGWARFSSCPVDIHILPGNHKTMLEEPNVQTLANRLRKCIGEVESA
jgi:thioesterase domain-containing protein